MLIETQLDNHEPEVQAEEEVIEDIDLEDADDPLNVVTYVSDIFDHCFEIEVSFHQFSL